MHPTTLTTWYGSVRLNLNIAEIPRLSHEQQEIELSSAGPDFRLRLVKVAAAARAY